MRCRLPMLSLVALTAVSSLSACARAGTSLKTYMAPSIADGSIKSVAIFPMRNARLLPDEALQLNREFAQAFHDHNAEVSVRYALLGLADGTVLWEGTSHAHERRAMTIGQAPPMYEVISIAQRKILTAMPQLGTGQR